ncbi:hypothetical protein Tco_1466757 [Tanacetum coccineum]
MAPPSPDYVPGPEHPPSPDYVPGPEYREYVAPSDDEVPIEDQPLLADASPTALSSGYVADSDPLEEDPEEDPEEDHAEYPADGEDNDDEEEGEDEEEEDEEEEEHLALADSTTLPAIDPLPSAEDIEAFKTDKSAPTPPSPPTHTSPTYAEALLGYRVTMIRSRAASPPPVPSPRLRRARISVRPQIPMAPATEALIAAVAAALPSSSPPPSPLTSISSPIEGPKELLMLWLSMKPIEAVEMAMIAISLELAEGQSELLMSELTTYEVKKYIGGLPDMIQGNVMASKPKTKQDTIEFATELIDQKIWPTLLGLGRIKYTEDLNLHVLNATTITMGSVLPSTPTARGLAIWPGTLGMVEQQQGLMQWEMQGKTWMPMSLRLVKYQGIIVYDEKIVCIPFGNEILIIHGDGSNNGHESRLNIISCTKTQTYLLKGCDIILAHVTTKKAKDKSKEKQLEDVPIVQDFPAVFPKDLSGIPPTRQVEFQIDFVPGAAPVARAPYVTPQNGSQWKYVRERYFMSTFA